MRVKQYSFNGIRLCIKFFCRLSLGLYLNTPLTAFYIISYINVLFE